MSMNEDLVELVTDAICSVPINEERRPGREGPRHVARAIVTRLESAGALRELSEKAVESRLLDLRRALIRARAELHEYVVSLCPAPIHQVVQHHDGQPPWCDFCGRDVDGLIRRA